MVKLNDVMGWELRRGKQKSVTGDNVSNQEFQVFPQIHEVNNVVLFVLFT